MKTKFLILFSSLAVAMSSCSTTSYYQLYKTSSIGNVNIQDGSFKYGDQNCEVTYNLWGENGNAGFKFYNKTDENIYLNMEDSFFILNGIANDYFGNRIVTSSNAETLGTSNKAAWKLNTPNSNFNQLFNISIMSSAGSTSSQSVSYTEKRTIIIPPKSAKIITEFNINNQVIRNCELLRYPTKREIKPLSFSATNSPLVFNNRISYKVANGSPVKFENDFYISEITNYPSSEFFEVKRDKDCNEKNKTVRSYKFASPINFYLNYQKIENGGKY